MTFTLRTAKPDVLISLGAIMVIFLILEILAVFLKWGQLCRNLTTQTFPVSPSRKSGKGWTSRHGESRRPPSP